MLLLASVAGSENSPQRITANPPLTLTNGLLSIPSAGAMSSGYLLMNDWISFNSRLVNPLTTKGDLLAYSTETARFPIGTNDYVLTADSTAPFGMAWKVSSGGAGITALTGDGTASGPGSAALTLATVNSGPGVYGAADSVAQVTVNAKGLTTAGLNVPIAIAQSQVTNLTSDLAGKLSTSLTSANIFVGNGSNVATGVAMTGDIGITNAGLTSIGTGVIVNADVNAAAAIAYSKLALTGSIVNADVGASAAIAYSKLASMATGNILAGNGGTPTSVTMSGGATIGNTGVVTLGNTAVTGQALTGFSSGAGTVSSADSILTAFNKIWGWLVNIQQEELNGMVQTAGNSTYYLVPKAQYARTINSINGLACSSGTITGALQIGGTPVTGCTALSVTSTPQDATCTAANTLSANGQLTFVGTSNSSCVNLIWTVKSTRT